MAIDASGIPRYAPPTGEELDEMFGLMKPDEVFSSCVHCTACLRVLELMTKRGTIGVGPDWCVEVAEALGCEDCEEWNAHEQGKLV